MDLEEEIILPFKPSLIVEGLDPARNEQLEKLLEKARVVVSDVDYTLVDISEGHTKGIAAIASVTSGETAERFNEIFHLILEGHRRSEGAQWDERDKFDHVMERMGVLQGENVARWGLKYWSKGTMIRMAAQDTGFNIDAKILTQARDVYWQTRTDASVPYDFTGSFYDYLEARKVPLVLFTSSYHILKIGEDMSFAYDPEFSEQYKREAISTHVPSWARVVIGDPVDKPDPRFFGKVVDEAGWVLGEDQGKLDLKGVCVVGDSLRNDLEYMGRMGCSSVLVKVPS